MRRIVWLILFVGCSSLALGQDPPVPQMSRVKSRQVLWLSRSAAMKKMQSLSLRAAREALAYGPPISAELSESDALTPGLTSDRVIINDIESDLGSLIDIWHEQEFDSIQIWETLRAIVLPASHPDQIFEYQRCQTSTPVTLQLLDRSAGSHLIRQTIAAGKVADLRAMLIKRSQATTASGMAWLMLLQLAVEQRNVRDAVVQLQSWDAAMFESMNTAQRVALSLTLLKAWRDKQLREALTNVMKSVTQKTLISEPFLFGDMFAIVMSNVLARHYFLQQQSQPALEHLEIADQLLSRQQSTSTSSQFFATAINHHLRAARLLLQSGSQAEAVKRIDEIIALEQSTASPSSLVSCRVVALVPWLHHLPVSERFRILRYCLLGSDNFYLMAPWSIGGEQPVPPAAFTENLVPKNSAPKDTSVENAASTDSPSSSESQFPAHAVSFLPMLFEAAMETGQSASLETDLLRLEAEGRAKATPILAIYYLHQGNAAAALTRIQRIGESLTVDSSRKTRGRDVALDLLVATAAIEFPATRDVGSELHFRLLQYSAGHNSEMVSQSRLSHALSIAKHASVPAQTLFEKATPSLWLSASNAAIAGSDQTARESRQFGQSRSAPRRLWLAHEGYLTHQGGPSTDSLYFPFPLTGSFEFSALVLDDVDCVGHLGFAGLTFESGPSSTATTTTTAAIEAYNSSTRTLRLASPKSYAKKSIRVTPKSIEFLINDHPIYAEEQAAHGSSELNSSSPWLSLFVSKRHAGVWKSLKFEGAPEILKEVSLSNDSRMRGWTCRLFDQTRSDAENRAITTFSAESRRPAVTNTLDWSWSEGVITGRRVRDAQLPEVFLDEGIQGHLKYDRPLASGETVSWEFEFSPDAIEVHPTMGQLAFLIRTDGVRLHWMSSNENEWTSIPADNEVVVETDRRGPSTIPLRTGWNAASLSLKGDTIGLSVNNVLVYEHTHGPNDNRQFGLFHFRDQTAARVRNITLTGDWPTSLTADHFQQMSSPRNQSMTASEKQTVARIVGRRAFSTDVAEVCQVAEEMPVEQRCEWLREWVFAGDSPDDWRLFGDVAPSDTVNVTGDSAATIHQSTAIPDLPLLDKTMPGSSVRRCTGGQAVSPVLQLLTTAKELGKLPELRLKVASVSDSAGIARNPNAIQNATGQISMATMNVLLVIEEGSPKDAVPFLKQLNDLVASSGNASMGRWFEQIAWPAVLAAQSSIRYSELRPEAIRILRQLAEKSLATTEQSTELTPLNPAFNRLVASLISVGDHLNRSMPETTDVAASKAAGEGPRSLSGWLPFRTTRADLRSGGIPQPLWVQNDDGSIEHVSGFDGDMLCYPSPLNGDFEFSCELTPKDGEHLLIGYGGYFFKPAATKEASRRIRFGRVSTLLGQSKEAVDVTAVWNYRLVVEGGQMKVFVNDQEVSSEAVLPDGPPWLCIRAAAVPGASIRNWQLKGNPTIPDSVTLSVGRDLDGWCQPYFAGDELFAPRNRASSDWNVDESNIVGLQRSTLTGTVAENLLLYFRPMMEDGTITYSFPYEPGKTSVAPAMDRLAFLLDKDRGVLVHQCTSGIYERSGFDPANAVAEPKHQLVTSLPLRVGNSGDWNTMQVRLQGNELTLILNDVEVFRRPLEPTNHRTFGLFHFNDQTTARARGFTWRGNWPRTLMAP